MSKRRQSRSPTPPLKLRRSETPEDVASLTCSLPPTCHRHPTHLEDLQALERHYKTYHTHVCQEKGCMTVFPDERLLELHFAECHDPIVAIRKERGEKTFACFVPTCERMFDTPAKRRMHLVDAHHYPKEYFFAVTNKGIAGLLDKWGEGASLVRPEWKPRTGRKKVEGKVEEEQKLASGPSADCASSLLVDRELAREETDPAQVNSSTLSSSQDGAMHSREEDVATQPEQHAVINGSSQPLGWTVHSVHRSRPRQGRAHQGTSSETRTSDHGHTAEKTGKAVSQEDHQAHQTTESSDAAVDDLATALSSVSLVPRTIRFGRGGARAGFARPRGWKRTAEKDGNDTSMDDAEPIGSET